MKFNSDRHHRRSNRLAGYDYTKPGAYFVTICTCHRESTFGMVQNQTVILSSCGEIVTRCWRALPDHFLYVELDTFVIMPNHLHGIVVIKDYGQEDARALSNGTTPKSLGAIIQNFKSVSTRKVNRTLGNTGVTIWQRGYYE